MEKIVALIVIVTLEATTTVKDVDVLRWIGQRTMVVVSKPQLGMIQVMEVILVVMVAVAGLAKASMSAQNILAMVRMWTCKLVITTMMEVASPVT